MILDRVVSVKKLTATPGDADKETWETLSGAEGIKMNIQPASAELTAISDGQYGKTFRYFTTYSGLKIGQRITVSGTSDTYDVKGVEDWNTPPLPHFEGVLFKREE